MTRVADGVKADVLPREPRCRICRDSDVRRLVNELLDWRGVPAFLEGHKKLHRVTHADILGWLEPLNEGREKSDRITYASLWNHARRHHDLAGVEAYWVARIPKDFVNALAG